MSNNNNSSAAVVPLGAATGQKNNAGQASCAAQASEFEKSISRPHPPSSQQPHSNGIGHGRILSSGSEREGNGIEWTGVGYEWNILQSSLVSIYL